MKHQLHTEITIHAPAARVWATLTDFARYPEWNPFVRRIEGALAPAAQLGVELQAPGGRPMTIRPRVSSLVEGRSFAWQGRLVVPGLFDGEHSFSVEPLSAEAARFVHAERFFGVLVPLLKKMLDGSVRQGFTAMNEALKQRVEARPA